MLCRVDSRYAVGPMSKLTAACVAATVLLISSSAHAQDDNPYETNLTLELPLLAGAVALWIGPVIIEPELPADFCNPCDRSKVNRIDRTVIGNSSKFADVGSDVLAAALPATLFLSSAYLQRDSFRGVVDDALIIFESMAFGGMINQLVRHAYIRPRPFMYLDPVPDDKRRGNAEDWHSFFSGHTSTAFAASTAFSQIYSARNPDSDKRYWVWAGTMGVASVMAVLRPASGEHFYSDVLAGAAVGIAAGTLIPALHKRDKDASGALSSGVNGGGAYASYAFTF